MNGPNGLFKLGMIGVLAVCMSGTVEAAPRSGLSFGLGLGVMAPMDDSSYMGIGADLYPELQVAYDIHAIKVGLSLGYIYREEEGYSYGANYYDDYSYEQSFVPLEVSASFLPVRLVDQNFVLQPYIGIGIGSYIAVGDNDDSYAMVSPHTGIEFQLGHNNVLGIDFSYHAITGEDDEGYWDELDLDYFTAMVVYRFRIPFSKTP